jgi:error-prone DNA polymerase
VLKRTLGVPLFQEQLLRIAMICSGFTGGEAEELRRAMGFKRSELRMRDIEVKLRKGMDRNGITGETQDRIVQAITSFALYGFPESHAASFALIAYASAFLKCRYLAAFTAGILNNQPMGFYQPATLIKDAQRHGLKVKPIDVTCSDWLCTIESPGELPQPPRFEANQPAVDAKPREDLAVRLGLLYVKGLRELAGRAIVRERMNAPFASIDDLRRRVPELNKEEMRRLAQCGALNFVAQDSRQGAKMRRRGDAERGRRGDPEQPRSEVRGRGSEVREDGSRRYSSSGQSPQSTHRRDALWQVERATRRVGPLLEGQPEQDARSPLEPMNVEERIISDFRRTGVTIGPHPMTYQRAQLQSKGVVRATDLRNIPNGRWVRVAGWVIARQRPGTAKGFLFLSMEDETGIANIIVTPDVFDRNRMVLTSDPFLVIDGPLQNQDNVIHVRAKRIQPLTFPSEMPRSRDFH